jgi:hypothetical protein
VVTATVGCETWYRHRRRDRQEATTNHGPGIGQATCADPKIIGDRSPIVLRTAGSVPMRLVTQSGRRTVDKYDRI